MEKKYAEIEKLVIESKNNNKDSLMKLYDIFLPYLKMWLSRIDIKNQTFDDISQEYFLWLVAAINKYSGSCTFTSYITVTIKNNLFMLVRKKYWETSTELIFLIQDTTCIEDLVVNKIDTLDMINNSKKLSSIERKVLIDYYFNDLTLYYISSNLNKKYSNIAKIKTNALKKLYDVASKNRP